MPDRDPNLNATFEEQQVVVDKSPSDDDPTAHARATMTSPSSSLVGRHFVAQLALESVRRDQSGNYSCSPSNASPVSVRLHLIDGELAF